MYKPLIKHTIFPYFQYTPNDPVVDALKKHNGSIATCLIELGFSCDKTYNEKRYVPCGRCKDCDNLDTCDKGEEKEVEVTALYLCEESHYVDLKDIIHAKMSS